MLCKLLYVVVTNVFILTTFLAVPGFRHGGVPWPYSPRWRQLSDHPCPAAHGRDAGAGSDPTFAALQTAGGQHDAKCHPEGSHLCCPCTQVGDHSIQQESFQPHDSIHCKLDKCCNWKVFPFKLPLCFAWYLSAVMSGSLWQSLEPQLRSMHIKRSRNMALKLWK